MASIVEAMDQARAHRRWERRGLLWAQIQAAPKKARRSPRCAAEAPAALAGPGAGREAPHSVTSRSDQGQLPEPRAQVAAVTG